MTRLTRHTGNRGAVLACLGLVWAIRGTAQPTTPLLMRDHLAWWALLLIWSVPGVVAIVAAVWPPADRMAWAVLSVAPTVWCGAFVWDWATGHDPAGWKGLTAWFIVAVLINRCAAGLDRPAPLDGKEWRSWTDRR